MKLHQKANYQCLTVIYKRCLKTAPTGKLHQGNKEIGTFTMLTASNQEKLQTLLQDRYLENKDKIPNDFGNLKACPEIKKAFIKSLAEESNDSGEEKCTSTKWEKLISHCSFAVSNICIQIINAILLQKRQTLFLDLLTDVQFVTTGMKSVNIACY